MKDTPEDIGQTPSLGLSSTEGPDIWYRNQDDGEQIFESENLIYNGTNFWVYVRVRNNSSAPSNSRTLDLHWTRLGTAQSWPSHWDGSVINGNIYGDLVGSKTIPALPANSSHVIKFQWNITPYISSFPNNNISACLLARIDNAPGDARTPFSNLYEDVKNNNNLTGKNVVIRDAQYFKQDFGGVEVFFGEPAFDDGNSYDIVFELPENYTENPLFEDAEVFVQFDPVSWNSWSNSGRNSQNIEVINEAERRIQILGNDAIVSDIYFGLGERATLKISANFLTEEVGEQNMYRYIMRQREHTNPEKLTGDRKP